jgi:hypothetical protein
VSKYPHLLSSLFFLDPGTSNSLILSEPILLILPSLHYSSHLISSPHSLTAYSQRTLYFSYNFSYNLKITNFSSFFSYCSWESLPWKVPPSVFTTRILYSWPILLGFPFSEYPLIPRSSIIFPDCFTLCSLSIHFLRYYFLLFKYNDYLTVGQ